MTKLFEKNMNSFSFFFNFNCSTYTILLNDSIKYIQNMEKKKKINPIWRNIPQKINNYLFSSINNNNSEIQR